MGKVPKRSSLVHSIIVVKYNLISGGYSRSYRPNSVTIIQVPVFIQLKGYSCQSFSKEFYGERRDVV